MICIIGIKIKLLCPRFTIKYSILEHAIVGICIFLCVYPIL